MGSQTVNELMLNFNLCIFLFRPSSQPHNMPTEHSVSHVIRFFFLSFFFFFITWGGGIYTQTGSMSGCAQVSGLIWQYVIRFGKPKSHMCESGGGLRLCLHLVLQVEKCWDRKSVHLNHWSYLSADSSFPCFPIMKDTKANIQSEL